MTVKAVKQTWFWLLMIQKYKKELLESYQVYSQYQRVLLIIGHYKNLNLKKSNELINN